MSITVFVKEGFKCHDTATTLDPSLQHLFILIPPPTASPSTSSFCREPLSRLSHTSHCHHRCSAQFVRLTLHHILPEADTHRHDVLSTRAQGACPSPVTTSLCSSHSDLVNRSTMSMASFDSSNLSPQSTPKPSGSLIEATGTLHTARMPTSSHGQSTKRLLSYDSLAATMPQGYPPSQ